ncbi:MAG: glutathione peroxidase [Xenococcaceae cyanobacterium]
MNNSIYDLKVKTIDGQEQQLAQYEGTVLLIVNVASYCGYTSQYQGLEQLNQKYRDRGLRILGFPCNDYGAQEPGTNAEIKTFCETRYGVSFPLFDKLHTLGSQKHPLYQYLTQQANPSGEVSWNFEKFLIDKQGKCAGRFKSAVSPDAPELVAAIEAELNK